LITADLKFPPGYVVAVGTDDIKRKYPELTILPTEGLRGKQDDRERNHKAREVWESASISIPATQVITDSMDGDDIGWRTTVFSSLMLVVEDRAKRPGGN
jgi:hypothetical protein